MMILLVIAPAIEHLNPLVPIAFSGTTGLTICLQSNSTFANTVARPGSRCAEADWQIGQRPDNLGISCRKRWIGNA